jgi:hypothetical protein
LEVSMVSTAIGAGRVSRDCGVGRVITTLP